jgi:phospholipid/cholesterol/gamma-HCH transport system ATP-binding protein
MELLKFVDFHKSFGSKKVHQGISFAVKKGECLGLVGGSGTGKSVLLRSMIGLEKPDQGEIWIDGTEVSKLKETHLI